VGDTQAHSQDGRKLGEANEAAIKISKVLENIAKNRNLQITIVGWGRKIKQLKRRKLN
jgi:hypothetical protein